MLKYSDILCLCLNALFLCADVKPSNMLVNTRGQVKLCDFGVSTQVCFNLYPVVICVHVCLYAWMRILTQVLLMLCMLWAQIRSAIVPSVSMSLFSSSSHSSRDFLPLLPNPQIPPRLLLSSHFSLFLITTLSIYSVHVSDGVCVRVAGDNSSDWESQHQSLHL